MLTRWDFIGSGRTLFIYNFFTLKKMKGIIEFCNIRLIWKYRKNSSALKGGQSNKILLWFAWSFDGPKRKAVFFYVVGLARYIVFFVILSKDKFFLHPHTLFLHPHIIFLFHNCPSWNYINTPILIKSLPFPTGWPGHPV